MVLKAAFHALILTVIAGFVYAQSTDLNGLQVNLREQYTGGRYADALKTSEAIIAMVTAQHGKDSLEAARAWANHATIEAAIGENKRSGESLDRAGDIFERHKDLDKSDASIYAGVLEKRASARMQVDMLSAENIFKRALKIRETAHGPNAPESATAISALANIDFWRRDYKGAADGFRRALDNLSKSTQPARDDVTLIYQRARCSLRKAKMESELEDLKQKYAAAAEFSTLGDPATPRVPKLINGGVVNGKALQLLKPAFPAEARRDRAEGVVEVDVLIDEQGNVVSACSAAGAHPALAESSEIAAYGSKFSPTKLAGNPVKVTGRITYNFRRY